MENRQVADVFDEIADLIELQEGNEYRIRSYRSAARTVNSLSHRLEDLVEEGKDLTEIPHIGKRTADKIHEILEKGTCKRLEELRKKVPRELTELMRVPRLGPRKAMQLYEELGIESLEDLKQACEDHEVRHLKGMGAKSEQTFLEGIETLSATAGRFLNKDAGDHVNALGRWLDQVDIIQEWEVAGSYRRRKETIGDLDILLQSKNRKKATESILDWEEIDEVMSRGRERVTIRLDSGLQVDFRFFNPQSFGAALLYFTGSKSHNIELRKRAVERDWKLNEYGLFKGKRRLAGKTEESVYRRLDVRWIPPELRESQGEIEAAEEDRLPELVELEDLRGDLHCHTQATDGADTIEAMAKAAQARKYSYLAITDHSKAVTVAKGLDEDRLKRHADEIRKTNDRMKHLWLLAGVEVDILKSGKLDLKEKSLSELDWVVAGIHSNLGLSKKKMTDRLVVAISSGVVHCISHLCCRMIGKRESIAFDVERVFEACRDNKVMLEINAQPDRLDLPDHFCRRAKEVGLTCVISTDAHKASDLDFLIQGVHVARRGWLEKGDVLNTVKTQSLRKRLKRG